MLMVLYAKEAFLKKKKRVFRRFIGPVIARCMDGDAKLWKEFKSVEDFRANSNFQTKMLFCEMVLSVHLLKKELRHVWGSSFQRTIGGLAEECSRSLANLRKGFNLSHLSPIMLKVLSEKNCEIPYILTLIRNQIGLKMMTLGDIKEFISYWKTCEVWRKDELMESHRKLGKICGNILGLYKKSNLAIIKAIYGNKLCNWCERRKSNLKKCKGCKRNFYCSRKHQKAHWREGHAKTCGKLLE